MEYKFHMSFNINLQTIKYVIEASCTKYIHTNTQLYNIEQKKLDQFKWPYAEFPCNSIFEELPFLYTWISSLYYWVSRIIMYYSSIRTNLCFHNQVFRQ